MRAADSSQQNNNFESTSCAHRDKVRKGVEEESGGKKTAAHTLEETGCGCGGIHRGRYSTSMK